MAAPKLALEARPLRYTAEEYLALEREAEERHEYIDGEIFAMAGESDPHGDISVNLTVAVGARLKGTACRARVKDTKVRSGPLPFNPRKRKGLFSYPDLLVVCGPREFLDEHRDVLANPKVIFEILSPSTEAKDRGVKFDSYRDWNPTLSDYVLIWQSQPIIEHYTRQADGSWLLRIYKGLEQSLTIPSIACTLSLAEVFDGVIFPATTELSEDEVEPNETVGESGEEE